MQTLRLYEEVHFLDFSAAPIKVKMDTGAASGAIHAEDIEIIQRDGQYLLSFRPFGLQDVIEKDCYRALRVKSSNGHKEQRFTILTRIKIGDEIHTIRISLRDRSDMKTEAIIGSRFLRNKFIIDPR